jgi:hypothetical protein
VGESFESECRAVVEAARAEVAAGREPAAAALAARVHEAAGAARERGEPAAAVERTERAALEQLERVLAVHRARSLLSREPARRESQPPPRRPRSPLRTRPTVSGNMRLRREGDGEEAALVWDAAPSVLRWEVRVSERPDARSDYAVRETVQLPPDETRLPLSLGERPVRVHVLGRARGDRLLRRAMVSGLTRETWRDRWQQRATAS